MLCKISTASTPLTLRYSILNTFSLPNSRFLKREIPKFRSFQKKFHFFNNFIPPFSATIYTINYLKTFISICFHILTSPDTIVCELYYCYYSSHINIMMFDMLFDFN